MFQYLVNQYILFKYDFQAQAFHAVLNDLEEIIFIEIKEYFILLNLPFH